MPLQVLDLNVFVPEQAVLSQYAFLGGGSTILDLLLLKHLAMTRQPCTYFEIGTYRGESLLAVLPHVEHAHSLDLDDQHMNQLRFSPEMQSQMQVLLKNKENIDFIKGDSRKVDFQSLNAKCDLIFIDGNHTFEYVKHDTESVLNHLAQESTIIVWHDYAIDPEQVRWEVLTGIRAGLPQHLHQYLYHIENTKCAVLIKDDNLVGKPAQFPQRVTKTWEVTIRRNKS